MTPEIVDRTVRSSLVATAVAFPFLLVHVSAEWAMGVALASLWSCANVWMISMVVREYFGPRRTPLLALLLGVKFPLLYGIGIWGLSQRAVPALSILVGFHIIFLVLVLKVLSQRLLCSGNEPGLSEGGAPRFPGSEERS